MQSALEHHLKSLKSSSNGADALSIALSMHKCSANFNNRHFVLCNLKKFDNSEAKHILKLQTLISEVP